MTFLSKIQQQTQRCKHLLITTLFERKKSQSRSRYIILFLRLSIIFRQTNTKYHIHLLKSKIDEFLKLQPPKNKKGIQNYVGFLTFISKYIYNLQVILRPFISNSEIQLILKGPMEYNKLLTE